MIRSLKRILARRAAIRALEDDRRVREALVGKPFAKRRQAQLRRSPTLVLSLGDRV